MRVPSSRPLLWLVALIAVNAAYLAAFDSLLIFYHANVIAHVVLGVLLAVFLVIGIGRWWRSRSDPAASRIHWAVYGASAVLMTATGLWLTYVGTASPYLSILVAHEIAAVLFLVALVLPMLASRQRDGTSRVVLGALAASLLLFVIVGVYGRLRPAHVARITNPPLPPATAFEEGEGQESPFFPSSNRTRPAGLIPSDFFLESKACGNKGCHPDITAQWDSSAHHLSSFNNQWYRKSIEYMQDVVGTKPSKWCGGCHDMAILLTGRMDQPIREQIETPEAQAGIGCLVCHSISHVHDTMGQGSFTLEYPEMHKLVASHNPVLEFLHDRMVMLDPGPHKAAMLKPFHRQSTAEFCASCHKVHLDKPVNHYRWFRGFNDYDPWQQSGVSGLGARAFYYPDEPKKCTSCHMPLVKSNDQGNVDGFVHSHRFPGANTALPFVNGDKVQLDTVTAFLQNEILTLDIFAVSEEPGAGMAKATLDTPGASGSRPPGGPAGADAPAQAQSMFPSEEGLGGRVGAGVPGPPRPVIAPVERADAAVRPGSTVRVDVVARTRGIGHFFPGGTVDAFDVWLELKAEDAGGNTIFWSGWVADDGKGPVDPGAHFYRSVLVDAHGNRINKRNAWAARAVAYVRLIPPGAADTAHFRLSLPPDVRGPVKLTARMNYRKFNWWNTQWAYAGVRDPSVPSFAMSEHFDDGPWVFTGDTAGVSGKLKQIPDLPSIVVAEDVKVLKVGPTPGSPAHAAGDRERWNDYGIGLLLQRDFKGAARAFEKVTALEPGYAPGWVNRARVRVEEGEHAEAITLCDRALKEDPKLAGAHYFRGVALKSSGRYDEALASLGRASDLFPRDRVVLNAMGRIRFLKRQFREAVATFQRTLAVDPEDLTAHYNLMLSHRGLRDLEASRRHEALYERFKADESAQTLTGAFRRLNPDDNRERQAIHVHDHTWTPENRHAASGDRYGRPPPAARPSGQVVRASIPVGTPAGSPPGSR